MEAFFYEDNSGCWEDWDEYCLPNWDNDEECLAVTLDFLDSLGLTNAEADTFDSQVDIPGVECFTHEAWTYNDGGVCSETWRSFDAWC